MDINKKNRVELKNYFKKNAIPTEGNFADFIDAGVNQKEDGLYKPAGDALHVEASSNTAKTAIRLYETFTGNLSWAVGLYETGAAQSALVVSDSAGSTRMWIGAVDGLVHIGSPATPGGLTVGSLASTGAVTAASFNSDEMNTGLLTVGDIESTGNISADNTITANGGATVLGGPLNVGTSAGTAQPLNVWGALTASSTVTATGLITANGGLTTTGAINTGTLTASSTLTANGGLTTSATSAITANGGLTVPAGKTLTVNGTLAAQATTTAALTASGLVTANAGATVLGAALNVGTSAGNAQPLNVWGTLTANGGLTTSSTSAITANGGLTVPAGKTLTVSGTLAAQATTTAALTASGLVTANSGLSVASGSLLTNFIGPYSGTWVTLSNNLSVTGTISGSAGLTVTGGAISLGTAGSPQIVNAYGNFWANGGISLPAGQVFSNFGTTYAGTAYATTLTVDGALNANGGISIPYAYTLYVGGAVTAASTLTAGGLITASGGLNVSSGTLTAANSISANGGLTVPAGKAITSSGAVSLAPSSRLGYRFDKSLSQYADLPGTSANFSAGFTFQTWIYLHALEDYARVIDLMNGTNSEDAIAFMIQSNGSFALRTTGVGGGATITPSPANVLQTNVWTHLAISLGSGGAVKLYKNGVQIGSGTNVMPNNVVRNANKIGYSWYASANTYLNAVLSDLSIWTGAQIPSLTPPATNASGLIGYYKFYGATPTADACTNAGRIGDASLRNGPSSAQGFGVTWDDTKSAVTIDQAIIGTASVAQDFWTTPALGGTWVQYSTTYNPPGYFKDSLGVVHLRGVLSSGSTGTTAFTLPAGYKPQFTERLPAAAATSGCYVDVNTSGNVIINLSGAPAWVSLDGMTFRAYQ